MTRVGPQVSLDPYFQFAASVHELETEALATVLAQIYAQLPFPDAATGFDPALQAGTPLRQSPFALQASLDPRAVATLAEMATLPTDNFLSHEEINTNLAETYGPYAPLLAQHIERAQAVGLIALLAALQGAGPDDLMRILGSDNPGARPFAQGIMQLAQALQQQPLNPEAITQALQGAEWSALPYAAGEAAIDMAMAQQFYRQQYGIGPPGSAPYYGQGGFRNHVGRVQPGYDGASVPTGQFTGPPSQAGLNALRAAQSQLGVCEATGCNDGVPAGRFSGGRNEPWCANFVSWAFRQAGQPLPGNQRALASAQYMQSVMQQQGRFHNGVPQPGDIVFFTNGNRTSHVGIVESVSNGRVTTIEGNAGNQVSRRSYPLGSARIAGYGRAGGASADYQQGPVSNSRSSPNPRVDGNVERHRGQVDRLFSAITGQESGGNYGAVNRDSGALGVGQVMPANVRAWSREALGYEISPETFKSRPDLQQQIVQFKLEQYYREGLRVTGDDAEAVRYAAAKWYSGDGNKRNNTRPQTYNGGSYPSIAHYSDQVLRRYLA